MKQKLIPILDAGHGNDTPGKRSPKWANGTQLFEYEFNRDIVNRIAKMLDEDGIKFRILVPEVIDISLGERCRRANRINVEYNGKTFLISVHGNAGGGTGWEAYTSPGNTKADAMATTLYEVFSQEFPNKKMRKDLSDGDPDKESAFYILKHTACPAVLTENFFFDNEEECRFMMSEDGRNAIALAHVKAIKKIIL